jgi:hypothetical protein
MLKAAVPELDRMTDFALLGFCTSCVPKLRLPGDKLAAGEPAADGAALIAPPPPQEMEKRANARKVDRRIAAVMLRRCSVRVGMCDAFMTLRLAI